MFALLLTLLLAINFTLSNDILLQYRIDVGFPLNALDVLMMLLGLTATFASRARFETERAHRLLVWSVGLLITAAVCGVVGGMVTGVPVRQYVTAIRNLLSLPLAIFIGYRFLKTPASAKPVTYLLLACSVASALALLFLVRETSEGIAGGKSFDELRSVRYGGDGGIFAMCVAAYALVARVRLMRLWLLIPVMLICAASTFSAPHRSTYLMGLLLLLFSTLVLPRVSVSRRLAMTFIGTILIGVTLVAGALTISRITGRDFSKYVVDRRFKQMLPWYNEETGTTVTGTRLPAILLELKIWSESPIVGQGFAIQSRVETELGVAYGVNHNVWTSALAQCGLPGFLGYFVPSLGCLVVGYRMLRDQTERNLAIFGAFAAIAGAVALLWCTLSMSLNQQRPAIMMGLVFGMAFRARAMQLTLARQYEGYLEPGAWIDEAEGYWGDGGVHPAAADHGGSLTA